jgi:hypothetical protein
MIGGPTRARPGSASGERVSAPAQMFLFPRRAKFAPHGPDWMAGRQPALAALAQQGKMLLPGCKSGLDTQLTLPDATPQGPA